MGRLGQPSISVALDSYGQPFSTLDGRSGARISEARHGVHMAQNEQHEKGVGNKVIAVETSGLEPPTPCLQSRCSTD
jgi:hypothetical protein